MAHRIRLRHPWAEAHQIQDLRAEAHQTQDLRAEARGSTGTHETTFSRRFNSPTGLSGNDRVEIELLNQGGEVRAIELNEQSLDFQSASSATSSDSLATIHRIPIGEILQAHNELRITLSRIGDAPELGEVNLWIHASDDSSK